MRWITLLVLILVLLHPGLPGTTQIVAVPPLMNFQGRLAKPDGTPVANGNYNLQFSLYNALAGGTLWWQRGLVNVPVRNGVFAARLDFGGGYQNGATQSSLFGASAVYLEISINGGAPLTPRQQFVTVAYAMKANSVPDASITSVSILDGTIATADIANNAITSAKILNGTITGVDIANTTITFDKFAADLFNPVAWLLGGNSGVTSGFLGTTDNQPLVFKVNNRRAMQYQYAENAASQYRSINVLGGSEINSIGPGVVGATIAGGGGDSFDATDSPNQVLSSFGTVGGGIGNTASGISATVGGGTGNITSGDRATVGGGDRNTASGSSAAVGGGYLNTARGTLTTVGGGITNIASSDRATVGGGSSNTASGIYATVGGGSSNTASGIYATVAGGYYNTAAGSYSFAAGRQAKAIHSGTFVWGDHTLDDFLSTDVNQFLIRASGGVGINTNNPTGATLRVNGGIGNVGVFAGDLAPFGTAAFESNLSSGEFTSHIWCANNGVEVFYVLGDGSVYASGYHNLSDARYKTHIQPVSDSVETVMALRGVTFDWDRERWKDHSFPSGRQIGFLAQEVEKVLPELVSTDANGYKSVAYANVVPVLVEAVKTLNGKVERLKKVEAENAELKARLDALEAALAELKANR